MLDSSSPPHRSCPRGLCVRARTAPCPPPANPQPLVGFPPSLGLILIDFHARCGPTARQGARSHSTVTAQPVIQHSHSTVTAQSQHSHSTATAQPQHSQLHTVRHEPAPVSVLVLLALCLIRRPILGPILGLQMLHPRRPLQRPDTHQQGLDRRRRPAVRHSRCVSHP